MIRIYGASDDLVEIDGDIEFEQNSYDKEVGISIPNVIDLSIKYDNNGLWKIDIKNVYDGHYSYYKCNENDEDHEEKIIKDCPGYSDVLILYSENIKDIYIGKKLVNKK